MDLRTSASISLLQVWTRTRPQVPRRPPELRTMYACYCRAPGEDVWPLLQHLTYTYRPAPLLLPLSRPITSAAGLATCAAVSGLLRGIPLLPRHRRAPGVRAALLGLPTGLRRGPAPAVPRARLPGAIAAGARGHGAGGGRGARRSGQAAPCRPSCGGAA